MNRRRGAEHGHPAFISNVTGMFDDVLDARVFVSTPSTTFFPKNQRKHDSDSERHRTRLRLELAKDWRGARLSVRVIETQNWWVKTLRFTLGACSAQHRLTGVIFQRAKKECPRGWGQGDADTRFPV